MPESKSVRESAFYLNIKMNEKLEDKINYFITPYNNEMHIDKFMKFDDTEEKTFSEKTWGQISKLIFNKDQETLRILLKRINNELYK